MIEESGFESGELDDILWGRLKKREFLHRARIKLEIAVAGIHAEEMDELRRDVPNRPEGLKDDEGNPVDVALISPSTLDMVDRIERRKKIESMPEKERSLKLAEILRKRRLDEAARIAKRMENA
ncbi:MAG: hypothetical protein MJZ81_09190 [Bacteroidales bacterium]|nr:hypothetical protein [Bacteroidales bacterium]